MQVVLSLPTSEAAQGCWLKDWYQISLALSGSSQRFPMPG